MNNDETKRRDDVGPTIQRHVDDFVAGIGYKQRLVVSPIPYYPYDDPGGCVKYPHSDEPGCYVWADGGGRFLDVGKASRHIGTRVSAHIGRRRRPDELGDEFPCAEHFIHCGKPNVAVWTVPVPEQQWWLCLSLEGYLAERLLPDLPRRT
jgi:hypothetical protein